MPWNANVADVGLEVTQRQSFDSTRPRVVLGWSPRYGALVAIVQTALARERANGRPVVRGLERALPQTGGRTVARLGLDFAHDLASDCSK